MDHESDQATLPKPRILCLHGAGLTGEVFRLQARGLVHNLAPYFRLVFVDGPWESDMHPDIGGVYDDMGPYRRWFRWKAYHPPTERDTTVRILEDGLVQAMKNDPGTGEWVGLMGFSQGAHLSASILFENQFRKEAGEDSQGFAGVWWKFAIILAGAGPPRSLSSKSFDNPHFAAPESLLTWDSWQWAADSSPPLLKTPTLHVHGLQDSGLDAHRRLFNDYSARGSASLIEWDAGHRLPYKTADVARTVRGILNVAKAAGHQTQ